MKERPVETGGQESLPWGAPGPCPRAETRGHRPGQRSDPDWASEAWGGVAGGGWKGGLEPSFRESYIPVVPAWVRPQVRCPVPAKGWTLLGAQLLGTRSKAGASVPPDR